MSKKILIYLCALILLCPLCAVIPAEAASLKISSFSFNQEERRDIMGPGGDMEPDGKPDASFSLSVSGASAITEITVEHKDSGTKWSTNTPKSFLALVGSDGQTINSSGRLNVLPVLLAANYKLYISDVAKEMAKETSCTVTVRLIDGSTVTATTNVVPPVTEPAVSNATDGITSAESIGVSGYDLAGSGKSIGADGSKDSAIKTLFSFQNTSISGIKVQATDGSAQSTWDTLKGSGSPLLVVLDKDENIINKADGSISIAVAGSVGYTLLLQDSTGILAKASSSARLTVSLADGRVFEKQIDKSKVAATTGGELTVSFKGRGSYDFVGKNEKLEPNLNADLQINAEARITGTVSGIRIKSASGRIWDTIPANRNWLLAVTDSKANRLNKADGSVSIALSGPASFSLWFEEDDKSEGPFTVTFVLTTGQIIEAVTEKPADQGKEVVSDTRGVKFVSTKPAVSNIDIVGKNKKLASNGAKDHSIKIQVSGKGQITSITLKDPSSAGWDTLTSNNGRWLLAVREGNKTLNSSNGTVKIDVNGTKELTLFAQNNGKLSAAKGKLIVEMTWSGGEVTQDTITW